jgi:TRAP-type C4-dicarboxylate transport system substrate-binding protein
MEVRTMRVKRNFFILIILIIFSTSLWAQNIRIGSIAPERSPWGEALNKLAADWAEISNGRVRLTIFHGGVIGNETDMLRKLKLNQIQGGVFGTMGLKDINRDVLTVSMPFLIQSDEELSYIFKNIRDDLTENIEKEGYIVIAWTLAGWVHIYSNVPVTTPDDLRAIKLSVNPDDTEYFDMFQNLGFNVVPVRSSEALTSLNSGRSDAVYASPLAAGGFQWFAVADNMLDMKVSPFLGAILISERTWRRIPDSIKPELLEAARQLEIDLSGATAELETAALEQMIEYGLNINSISESEIDIWKKLISDNQNDIVGTIFPRGMYDRIKSLLEDVE